MPERFPFRMKPGGARRIHAAREVEDRLKRGMTWLRSACDGWVTTKEREEAIGRDLPPEAPVTCKVCLQEMAKAEAADA